MFDFFFGGEKKLNLIRALLKQRMIKKGYTDSFLAQNVKSLSGSQLVGTPEGSLVTIVHTIIKSQQAGALLANIFIEIENHRKNLGSNEQEFQEVLTMARSNNSQKINASFPAYCFYRMKVECEGLISEEEYTEAWIQSVKEIASW